MKANIKSIILIVAIFAVVIAAVSIFTTAIKTKEEFLYSDLVELFDYDLVTSFDVDGKLVMAIEAIVAKRADDGSLAVGIFNLSVDSLIDATVELGGEYSTLETVNCEATLDVDKVHLGDIPPFSFAALSLKK